MFMYHTHISHTHTHMYTYHTHISHTHTSHTHTHTHVHISHTHTSHTHMHTHTHTHKHTADIMSDNHLATITLVNFFCENIYWLNNGNTHLPALCAGGAPDEKLKINKLTYF